MRTSKDAESARLKPGPGKIRLPSELQIFLPDLACAFQPYETVRAADGTILRRFFSGPVCGCKAPRDPMDKTRPRYAARVTGDPLCEAHARYKHDTFAFPDGEKDPSAFRVTTPTLGRAVRKAWNVCGELGCFESTHDGQGHAKRSERRCRFHHPKNLANLEKGRRRDAEPEYRGRDVLRKEAVVQAPFGEEVVSPYWSEKKPAIRSRREIGTALRRR